MASFDSINYSIRPSKSVQRGLVFEGLRRVFDAIDLEDAIYVGFGSIWFTDFVQAHKVLNIEEMVSMESDEIGFRRAEFNKAYRTIAVLEGRASERLPDVLEIDGYDARPWVIWLDYDCVLDEEVVEDMRWVVTNAPPNSSVLFTFGATAKAYGRSAHRSSRLRKLLGGVVPDDLPQESCSVEELPYTLAKLTVGFLKSEVADSARLGRFIEAFRLTYHDSAAMVTVGGILPAEEEATAVKDLVASPNWNGLVDELIEAPLMTLREVATLQTELPSDVALDRERIRALGFDLDDRQIRSFQKYYKYLPSFAEIVA